MKLTTRSRYGVRMVLDIARHQGAGPVRVGDIAKRQDLSVKYLEFLLQELKKAGYLKSVRGPKGGHLLAKPAEEITVAQLVEVLEGSLNLVNCDQDEQECPRAGICPTRELWQDIERAVYERLQTVSVRDLLEREDDIISGGGMA